MKIEIEETDIFSIEICENNPTKLYIFGDNVTGQGKGGQAIIRDMNNSYGISTKTSPYQYFTDESYDINIEHININIWNIKSIAKDYNKIVFPSQGLGTGRARMMQECPKTFLYLCNILLEEFGYNNLKNLCSKNF